MTPDDREAAKKLLRDIGVVTPSSHICWAGPGQPCTSCWREDETTAALATARREEREATEKRLDVVIDDLRAVVQRASLALHAAQAIRAREG
jgi:hypothetical protein